MSGVRLCTEDVGFGSHDDRGEHVVIPLTYLSYFIEGELVRAHMRIQMILINKKPCANNSKDTKLINKKPCANNSKDIN